MLARVNTCAARRVVWVRRGIVTANDDTDEVHPKVSSWRQLHSRELKQLCHRLGLAWSGSRKQMEIKLEGMEKWMGGGFRVAHIGHSDKTKRASVSETVSGDDESRMRVLRLPSLQKVDPTDLMPCEVSALRALGECRDLHSVMRSWRLVIGEGRRQDKRIGQGQRVRTHAKVQALRPSRLAEKPYLRTTVLSNILTALDSEKDRANRVGGSRGVFRNIVRAHFAPTNDKSRPKLNVLTNILSRKVAVTVVPSEKTISALDRRLLQTALVSSYDELDLWTRVIWTRLANELLDGEAPLLLLRVMLDTMEAALKRRTRQQVIDTIRPTAWLQCLLECVNSTPSNDVQKNVPKVTWSPRAVSHLLKALQLLRSIAADRDESRARALSQRVCRHVAKHLAAQQLRTFSQQSDSQLLKHVCVVVQLLREEARETVTLHGETRLDLSSIAGALFRDIAADAQTDTLPFDESDVCRVLHLLLRRQDETLVPVLLQLLRGETDTGNEGLRDMCRELIRREPSPLALALAIRCGLKQDVPDYTQSTAFKSSLAVELDLLREEAQRAKIDLGMSDGTGDDQTGGFVSASDYQLDKKLRELPDEFFVVRRSSLQRLDEADEAHNDNGISASEADRFFSSNLTYEESEDEVEVMAADDVLIEETDDTDDDADDDAEATRVDRHLQELFDEDTDDEEDDEFDELDIDDDGRVDEPIGDKELVDPFGYEKLMTESLQEEHSAFVDDADEIVDTFARPLREPARTHKDEGHSDPAHLDHALPQ